jgi:hypothetical protein
VVVAFAFVPLLGSLPRRLVEHWVGSQIVWDREVVWTVATLALLTVLATFGGMLLASRKRDFV